jgi:hypothetical protein
MSELTLAAPPRRRRRWPWLLLVPLLLVAAALGYHLYQRDAADKELAAAVAETDRTDPDWRLEQIEAKRKTYAPEDNAAETVLAASRLLPPNWPASPPPAVPPADGTVAALDDRADGLPPEVQFDAALVRDLRAEFARDEIKGALAATEPLSRQTGGRFATVWGPNPLSFDMPYQNVRPVVHLLRLHAALQSQDDRHDDALATVRRIVVAAQSIGDEPTIIAQLIRVAEHAYAVRALERALAQGVPSDEALAHTARLLEEDAAEPLLVYAYRGERALQYRTVEFLKSGEASNGGANPANLRQRVKGLHMARALRAYEPGMLRTLNEAVAVAGREPEDQAEGLQHLDEAAKRTAEDAPTSDYELAQLLMPAIGKVGVAFRRDRAILRGAIVAVAAERFRQARQRWPENLNELVPAYLSAVPRDPFDGQPMRYRRMADGVIVYSVGPDGKDNGGAINRGKPTAEGTDLGFRLWDAAARRKPAAEALPPPNEDTP